MSILELKRVSKVYPGGHVAVSDLDLAIDDGEFFVLVGPSGCGKTSVLRMVAGLEEATAGDILIDGERVNDETPQDRDVAMAFQQHALYPHMTVAENIGFSLRVHHVPKAKIDERVAEVARTLDLVDVLDEKPRRLSGGQQQRVAMGRAIIRGPRLLLMDEPMSNLDAKLRTEARFEILKIQHRLGATTMYVTHDQVEAMAMGDRIAVMRDGVIVQRGLPMDIYTEPVDLFVAQFIGSPMMNVYLASVERGDGSTDDALELRFASFDIPLDRSVLDRHPWLHDSVGREVAVGIRPEDLERAPDGPIVASVTFTETLGPDQLVHGTIEAVAVHQRGSRVEVEDDAEPGEGIPNHATVRLITDSHDSIGMWAPLRLQPDTSRLYFFDLQTGRRI
ncbi:MAG: ATP-binding cassette domain-containing protein [Ilumatobacter sp.]|uniref:ABC transporter ATP-binding protein n=1 Tax=Ilumatobacter sp. TaxID=1967498 RepID=UPI00261FF8B8|nr:ATP-binding cassette domain-containing protein [Ilumatobacter sp.]MDJ0767280.1 ATP-binding cassette domain-containing protein [Ilumatobacter sp.]